MATDRNPRYPNYHGQIRAEHDATREQIFFEELARHGMINTAMKVAGLPRNYVWRQMRNDSLFRARFDQSVAESVEVLRKECLRRAVTGVPRPIYHQGMPVYLYRSVVDSEGVVVKDENGNDVRELVRDETGQPVQAVEMAYSDTLLLAELKAHDRAYREKASVEVSGPGGGPLEVESKSMSDLEIARRLMYALQRGVQAAKQPSAIEDQNLLDDPGGDLV